MNQFLVVLTAVLPVFCIAGAGAFMRRVEWLTAEADHSLLRVTVNLLAPALIFDSILGNQALEKWSNVALAPLVGFGAVALGVAVGYAAQKLIRFPTPEKGKTFAFSVGIFNYGYVPIPLAIMLFGKETVGVLFVHNVGVEIAFWTLGGLLLGHRSPQPGWKRFINPPMIAIAIALACNAVGLERWAPEFFLTTVNMLGLCAIPIGLILIGATMWDHLHEFTAGSSWPTMIAACLLRLGALPVLFLLLAHSLPASDELKQVILLQAAMPSAVFAIILAKHYRGDPGTALRVVVSTSIVALITIPLWIRVGRSFLGL